MKNMTINNWNYDLEERAWRNVLQEKRIARKEKEEEIKCKIILYTFFSIMGALIIFGFVMMILSSYGIVPSGGGCDCCCRC